MTGLTEREFAGDARSPAAARGFAKSTVTRLLGRPVPPLLGDDIELIVSELVTNAVRAGSSRIVVGVGLDDGRIRLHVTDEAGGWPEPRHAGVYDTHGRGLPLVSALSASWGGRLAPPGKVVWAELAVPGPGNAQ